MWYFKVTYHDNVPSPYQWFGPFATEQEAQAQAAAQSQNATRLGRQDTFDAPQELQVSPFPSPGVMVVSGPDENGNIIDWVVHEDGTRTKKNP